MGLDGKELNLVHRDVSPQNVLISFEGDIKLCDFGIAKAATKVQQTQAGALKGKLQYMSPEQAWGKKVDRRTDIFSLGIVLFEMLTGERLFSGDTDLTILEQVRDARSEPPSLKNPDVPKKVDQIVLKALAKNPQDRYQNASEMEKDINSVLYSFQPAPGPADLAIYMHRLVEATAAASDAQIDAAFAQAAQRPPRRRRRRGRGSSSPRRRRRPSTAPRSPRRSRCSRARADPVPRRRARASRVEEEPHRSLRRHRRRSRRPRRGGLLPDARQGAGAGSRAAPPAAVAVRDPGRARRRPLRPAADAREGHRPEGPRGRAPEGDGRGGEEAPRRGAEGRGRTGEAGRAGAPPSRPLRPSRWRRASRSSRRRPLRADPRSRSRRRPAEPTPVPPTADHRRRSSPRPRVPAAPAPPAPPLPRPPRAVREGDLVGPGRGSRRAAARASSARSRRCRRRPGSSRRGDDPTGLGTCRHHGARRPRRDSVTDIRVVRKSRLQVRRRGGASRPLKGCADPARHEGWRPGEDVEDLRHHRQAVRRDEAET